MHNPVVEQERLINFTLTLNALAVSKGRTPGLGGSSGIPKN